MILTINKINIATVKAAQYKILDINKKTYFNKVGQKIEIFYPKKVIEKAIDNLRYKIADQGVFGLFGYSEDGDLGENLSYDDLTFKIENIFIDNNVLYANISILDTLFGNRIIEQNIENFKLKFSAFIEFKKYNIEKCNKVKEIIFQDFYLVNNEKN